MQKTLITLNERKTKHWIILHQHINLCICKSVVQRPTTNFGAILCNSGKAPVIIVFIVRAAILSTRNIATRDFYRHLRSGRSLFIPPFCSIATRSDFSFVFAAILHPVFVIPPFCGFRGIPASTCDDRGVNTSTQRSGQLHHLRHHTSIYKLYS